MIFAVVAGSHMAACGTSGSSDEPRPKERQRRLPQRTVVVFDPTTFADMDSVELVQGPFLSLREFVRNPAINSALDVYIVRRDRINAGPDFQGSIPFDPKAVNDAGYGRRADSLARAVGDLALDEWRKARATATVPNSCILTSVGRTQNSLQGARAGNEAAVLVVVSDLLELCDEAGSLNFERSIPEALDSMPGVDLSGFANVYVVKVTNRRLPNLAAAERLDSFWRGTLERFLGDSIRLQFSSVYPTDRDALFHGRRAEMH